MYLLTVPTYKRPEKLIRFIDSYLKADRDGVELRIGFDNNDWESKDIVERHFGLEVSSTIAWDVYTEQNRAFRIWNRTMFTWLEDEKYKGMFHICDDVELYSDCLQVAINELEKRFPDGDGIIGLNQANIYEKRGFSGFAKAGMGLMGRKFINRFPKRRVFCPDYISFRADNELLRFSESKFLFYWSERAKLTHHHPRFGGIAGAMDETHKKVRDGNCDEDRLIYDKRRKLGYRWGNNFKLLFDAEREVVDVPKVGVKEE